MKNTQISRMNFKLVLSPESRKLMDSAKNSGVIKSVKAKIEATHSGIVNKNL